MARYREIESGLDINLIPQARAPRLIDASSTRVSATLAPWRLAGPRSRRLRKAAAEQERFDLLADPLGPGAGLVRGQDGDGMRADAERILGEAHRLRDGIARLGEGGGA